MDYALGCSMPAARGRHGPAREDPAVTEKPETPKGELTLRTLTMPRDTNPNGDIFGGWLVSEMDMAGGVAAQQYADCRVATVAIETMVFHKPVFVGDVLCCYTHLERVGTTSMTFRIQVWAIRGGGRTDRIKVTEGLFTFVAIGEDRRPMPIRSD